jgi:hypothetical protein
MSKKTCPLPVYIPIKNLLRRRSRGVISFFNIQSDAEAIGLTVNLTESALVRRVQFLLRLLKRFRDLES